MGLVIRMMNVGRGERIFRFVVGGLQGNKGAWERIIRGKIKMREDLTSFLLEPKL
jgi:hypothetical protein